MRSIAIINQKGGSGKTTTTVNLAAALAEKKRKVLVIDLDPQASTTQWFGFSSTEKGIYSAFVENVSLASIVAATAYKNISLVPSSTWLIGVEKLLAHEVGSETLLKHHIEQMGSTTFDYILIDCPPTLGVLTVNALSAVHEVIVPVETRFMALSGLVQLLQTIEVIKQRLNPELAIAGIVPCRVDARTKHAKEVIDELKNNFKDMLFKTAIRENIKLSEASSFSEPIFSYDDASHGAADYRAFAKEVMKQEVI
ncbi:MAG TPA: ParA family protein [Candidatus Babeliales bacterium]|nr:ParA family protein [Candidatus Babeliales bacterium]